MLYNVITNPFSVYGAYYIPQFIEIESGSYIYHPKRKKLKGYQKASKRKKK